MPDNNHTTKASVFEDLFSDKEYLFQLYKVLHPEDDKTTIDLIQEVTLSNIFLRGRYNDLGMMVGNKLIILVEAQSTWSVNIIPRCIMYLADTWNRYGHDHEFYWYGEKKVALPESELYVVYTGDKEINKSKITLSEEFFEGRQTDIDATVKVITQKDGDNILSQYITFCKVYDEQRKKYPVDCVYAITETIRICSEKDVLAAYLKDKEKEVKSIMLTLFNQEEARRMEIINERKEAKEEGRAEGEAKGRAEGEAKGRAEERKSFIQLLNLLLKSGRVDDVQRISEDALYCNQLMLEFGLA